MSVRGFLKVDAALVEAVEFAVENQQAFMDCSEIPSGREQGRIVVDGKDVTLDERAKLRRFESSLQRVKRALAVQS